MFFQRTFFLGFIFISIFPSLYFSNCFSCMVSSRCFFQYFSKIMFPCIFFFKNCISSISFPAQFQDVFFQNLRFFQNVFSSIGFSMSIFPELYFANFFLHVMTSFFQYVFSRIGVSRCDIFFSSAVFCQFFPAPWFFQNVFSRIAAFFPEPSAYIFSRMFFQNCILPILLCTLRSSIFSRMFFPELHFANFFPAPSAYHFFQDVFSRIAFLLFFFCALCLSVFFQNVFSRIVFCQFFPAPSNASFFRKVFSRIGVSLCSIFFQNCILPCFPAPFDFQFFPLCFFPKRCSKNT